MNDWFSVHKTGLRQTHEPLIERVGFGIIGGELYQNVMDTTATECIFEIEKIPNKPRIRITVTDNGEGFQDLSHAWTMYAPSIKKDNPLLAGRFNIGEKMVLAFASEAEIHTTSGTVAFNEKGRDLFPRRKRDIGTRFTAELACNSERYDQLIEYMRHIIVKPGLKLVVNGEEIPHRTPIKEWSEALPTEIGEDLRPSIRKTTVQVYELLPGEKPRLHELGIPVVETEDKWHVSIMQKCPLNKDRDNVTPSFLRLVRVSVFNNMHSQITSEDTEQTWVNEATSDSRCTPEAVETFRVQKYGKKSVSFDGLNIEATNYARSEGYMIIPPHGLTKGQRDNLKSAGTLLSASQEFSRIGKGAYSTDPDAPPAEIVPYEKWSESMRTIARYASQLGERLVGCQVTVSIVNVKSFVGQPWGACYGPGRLDFNLWKLGRDWFERNLTPTGVTEALDDLLLHEFGHHVKSEADHLSSGYHEALTRLGAKLKALALADPAFFRQFKLGV